MDVELETLDRVKRARNPQTRLRFISQLEHWMPQLVPTLLITMPLVIMSCALMQSQGVAKSGNISTHAALVRST